VEYYKRDLTKKGYKSPYSREEFNEIFNHKFNDKTRQFKRIDYNWKYDICRKQDYNKINDYTPENIVTYENIIYQWHTTFKGYIDKKYINEFKKFDI
jgi:hypothetical protein